MSALVRDRAKQVEKESKNIEKQFRNGELPQ
jgi:hypothetical protein